MTSNPTREIRIKTGRSTRARALTPDEQDQLLEGLRADELAVAYDLVDLVDFMLHSGVRIGEACALRVPYVDLDAGVVEIAATLTDFGIEERPKTAAGWRRIALPPKTMEMIGRRIDNPAIVTDVAVFPSRLAGLRNRSNTTGDLRRALDRIGYPWVSSHTFRKTAITRLDDAGLSATADRRPCRACAPEHDPGRLHGQVRRELRGRRDPKRALNGHWENVNGPRSALLLVRGRMRVRHEGLEPPTR